MDNLLQWSDTFAKRSAYNEQKGQDSLTESIGQQKAYQGGANFMDGITSGSRFVEEQKDPMFALKKKDMELQIAQHSANLADKWREMELKKQQVDYEQEDYNKVAKVTLDAGGDVDKLISGLGSITTRSGKYGLEVHQKMNDLVNFQNKLHTTKNEAMMTKGLNDMISKGIDTQIGREATQLNLDYQSNGWTPENVRAYGDLYVRHNQALAAAKDEGAIALINAKAEALAGNKTSGLKMLKDEAEKERKAGNLEWAQIYEDRAKKLGYIAPVSAGSVKKIDPETGDVLTVRLSPSQLENTPAFTDASTKKMLKDYADEKSNIAAGDLRHWYGTSRQANFDELKAAIIKKGIDPDTGLLIKAKPDGFRKVSDAVEVKSAPYPEGTRLNGPGGKIYIVKDGQPVPE